MEKIWATLSRAPTPTDYNPPLCLPDSHVQALWTVSAVLFQQL
jgi:hypothetical protein